MFAELKPVGAWGLALFNVNIASKLVTLVAKAWLVPALAAAISVDKAPEVPVIEPFVKTNCVSSSVTLEAEAKSAVAAAIS